MAANRPPTVRGQTKGSMIPTRLSSPTKDPTTFGPSSGTFIPFRSGSRVGKCPGSTMFRHGAFRRSLS